MEGIVRWYSAQGFGFIDTVGDESGRAYYFHITAVKNHTVLKPGDSVTFEPASAPKGPKAINVCRIAVDTREVVPCPQTA